MVIDKTTGRGCALSLASETVTGKLIDDGIVGKTICRRQRVTGRNSYDLLQVTKLRYEDTVYVMSQKDKGLTEEPLWTPSFIDAEIWTQAVSKFPKFGQLDKSVEKYLLPEMDAYLQNISDTELTSLTRALLIKHGIINTPIRQYEGKTCYFSEDGVYSLDKNQIFPYEGRKKYVFKVMTDARFNTNVWVKATSRFEVGMTLDECIGIFLQTELVHHVPQELSPLDKLVQYIAPPVYERVPENNNNSTFDHIRMTVGLPRYQFDSWEALKDEIKKYQQEIYQRVIEKLEQDRQFKKYGVPINFLKLDNVMLLRDFSVEFVFTLKEPKTDSMPDKATTIIGSEGSIYTSDAVRSNNNPRQRRPATDLLCSCFGE